MKKFLFGLFITLLAVLACVYFFIPGLLNVSSVVVVNCTINGTNRYLLDPARWADWWPGERPENNSSQASPVFTYQKTAFRVTRPLYNGLEVLIAQNGLNVNSNIHGFQLSTDSIAIQWKYTLQTSFNPVTRWKQYQQARAIKMDMEALLVRLQTFLRKRSNIYGIDIQEIFSRDTTLTVTKDTSIAYPAVPEIYGLIEKLKKHISSEKALQTNYPMLHVRKLDNGQFETMVAIPVNRPLKESGSIVNKRFVPWKTLVGETKGGVHTIEQAYKKMDTFVNDYQRMPMAIPFELLITDRSLQPDTSKWISVICQPVS